MRILMLSLALLPYSAFAADSMELNAAAQKVCLGENPTAARKVLMLLEGIGGHPIQFTHLLIKERLLADGPQWPENYVEEKTLDKVAAAALHRIRSGVSCRSAMGVGLEYQSIGLAARPALKKALGPLASEALAGSWLPPSEEALALNDRCVPKVFQFDEQNERETLGAAVSGEMQKLLGRAPVYQRDVTSELYWRAMQAGLRTRAPKSCDDVAALQHEIFRDFAAADNELRAKLEKVQARFGAAPATAEPAPVTAEPAQGDKQPESASAS